MKFNSLKLYIEIGLVEFNFIVTDETENDTLKIVHKNSSNIKGISKNKISDFDLVFNEMKNNIYSIEQKLNFIFKEANVIINNFEYSLINFSGYKKLNGSQLLKENITYIINSLKSKINELEDDRTILHIFNSKYLLDYKEVKNLPIGLFGDFYSHELSFFLINKNDFKNLNYILNKCNLRISKIIAKSFIDGTYLINTNFKSETFFKIEINKKNSQIIFFENSALKSVEDFNFGSEIIINDISKVFGLKNDMIINFLSKFDFSKKTSDNELLEKKFFNEQNYRKIRKKQIQDVAEARILELSELILTKNINMKSFIKKKIPIYLNINDNLELKIFEDCFKNFFSINLNNEVEILKKVEIDSVYENINKLVQFGWKQEAVPVVHEKKSFISRLFERFFK